MRPHGHACGPLQHGLLAPSHVRRCTGVATHTLIKMCRLCTARHLVLQHARPNASLPDLSVTGAHINVLLANARIARVAVANQLGEIRLDHLRADAATLRSAHDNVAYEDERDTALLYRSPNNAVCAAAPLVEAIPNDLQACDMNPPAAPLKAAHTW